MIRDRLGPLLAAVTPLGRLVVAAGPVLWVVGAVLGWDELVVLGAAVCLLAAVCLVWLIGRTEAQAQVVLRGDHVVAGSVGAGGALRVTAPRGSRLAVRLELALGGGTRSWRIGALSSGQVVDLDFDIATDRRGVIAIGPAVVVRDDPFGLFRRAKSWEQVRELFVHPVTAPLGPLGAGMIRDLEGYETPNLSPSDLAFHTLREYVPGDDYRHVHWGASAKLAATAAPGEQARFLVRQYLDTRRARLVVCLDADPAAYRSEVDFETAVSVAGSLAKRAVADEVSLTVVTPTHVAHDASERQAMDTLSRAVPVAAALVELTARAAAVAPDATAVLLLTGYARNYRHLVEAVGQFPATVRRVALAVDSEGAMSYRATEDLGLGCVRALADLHPLFEGRPLQ
ncbi:DUF58 domain-containing protein [Actinokineospora fastidiosa]|uniref:DUF58 domain-containing protein n=1 Tax=Actinokineospora fastidiosa TaxID=1816 RepID=A0A918LIX7_9PSEU|nr:DUF58 domain-containing protein [Actinokineospora fastidiosa]GGS54327.1 hypothetical protein GCM10010171_56810 [Actinokineospora fastidiosa]